MEGMSDEDVQEFREEMSHSIRASIRYCKTIHVLVGDVAEHLGITREEAFRYEMMRRVDACRGNLAEMAAASRAWVEVVGPIIEEMREGIGPDEEWKD